MKCIDCGDAPLIYVDYAEVYRCKNCGRAYSKDYKRLNHCLAVLGKTEEDKK